MGSKLVIGLVLRVAAGALALGLLGAGAANAQPRAAEPVYREVKQWVLGCDNTRRCEARFVASEFSPPPALRRREAGRISVIREAGPTGAVTIRLSTEGRYDEDAKQKTLTRFDPALMLLDGQPLAPRLAPSRRTGLLSEQVMTGDAALRFLSVAQGASLLTYSSRPDSPIISLDGLSEILLAMDQAQGRTNNISALIHGGGAGPASLTPPVLPTPLVHAAPATAPLANAAAIAAQVRRARRSVLQQHECNLDLAQDDAQRLNAREAVVVLSCNGGAYQGYGLAFRVTIANPAGATLLRLPYPRFLSTASSGDVAGEYGAGKYDPTSATFSQTSYGRGIGDCGMTAAWVFDGKDFHLASLTYQDRCGGVPGDWLTLYQTRVLELGP